MIAFCPSAPPERPLTSLERPLAPPDRPSAPPGRPSAPPRGCVGITFGWRIGAAIVMEHIGIMIAFGIMYFGSNVPQKVKTVTSVRQQELRAYLGKVRRHAAPTGGYAGAEGRVGGELRAYLGKVRRHAAPTGG